MYHNKCAKFISQDSCDQTLKLYQAYHRISTLQDKGSSSFGAGVGTSKRGSSGAVQSRNELSKLSLQCVITFLQALFRYVTVSEFCYSRSL